MARYLKNGLLVKTPKGSVKTKDIINSTVNKFFNDDFATFLFIKPGLTRRIT